MLVWLQLMHIVSLYRIEMKNIECKNILITGASSGIGKAFVHEFASRGANTVIVARSKSELQRLAEEIEDKYLTRCYPIAIDLTQENSVQHLYQDTLALGLDIHVLVNTAGYRKMGTFEDYHIKTYLQMLQLNINALTALCLQFLPDMKHRNFGGIINVASNAALIPVPYYTVYAGSKSYVLNFSESLSGELLDTDVTVCCFCPGGTKKPKFAEVAHNGAVKDYYADRPHETLEKAAKVAVEAFLKGKHFAMTGNKFVVGFLPRILTRLRMIKLTSKEFKIKLGFSR